MPPARTRFSPIGRVLRVLPGTGRFYAAMQGLAQAREAAECDLLALRRKVVSLESDLCTAQRNAAACERRQALLEESIKAMETLVTALQREKAISE